MKPGFLELPADIVAGITLTVKEKFDEAFVLVLDKHVSQVDELKNGFQERISVIQEQCTDLERALPRALKQIDMQTKLNPRATGSAGKYGTSAGSNKA